MLARFIHLRVNEAMRLRARGLVSKIKWQWSTWKAGLIKCMWSGAAPYSNIVTLFLALSVNALTLWSKVNADYFSYRFSAVPYCSLMKCAEKQTNVVEWNINFSCSIFFKLVWSNKYKLFNIIFNSHSEILWMWYFKRPIKSLPFQLQYMMPKYC
jgi:hypothetical protein